MTSSQKRMAALCLLLILAIPAAAQKATVADGIKLKRDGKLAEAANAFRSVLSAESENVDAMSQLAIVESWMKHYDESIRLWEKAVSLKPHEADFGIGLARVLYWKGELGRATTELDRVIAEHPKNAEALVLMGDVQLARGDPKSARDYYLRAQKLEADFPDIKLKLSRAVAPLRWRFDTGMSAEHFSDFRQNEQAVFEQLGYSVNRRTTVWARHEYLNRLGRVDNTYTVGGNLVATEKLSLLTEYSFTPRNGFEPNWKLHVGSAYVIGPRLTLTGDYVHRDYDVGDTNSFSPGFATLLRPWLTFNFKYNVSRNPDASVFSAYQFRGDFQVHPKALVYTGFAFGDEFQPPIPPASFRLFSTGVVWNVHRRLGIRADYVYEKRPNFYTHQSFGPGIRVSF